jgi:hypothetical protein
MSPPSSVEGGSLIGKGSGVPFVFGRTGLELRWKLVGDCNSLIDDRSKG